MAEIPSATIKVITLGKLHPKSISSRLPDEAPIDFFSSGRRYSAQPCPRFLVFPQI
jgi:hypothetical protein